MSTTNFPQDPYSVGDIVKGDYNADQAFNTSRARALKELDLINLEKSMAIEFALATTQVTAAVGASMATFRFHVSDWMWGKKLNLVVEAAMEKAEAGDKVGKSEVDPLA